MKTRLLVFLAAAITMTVVPTNGNTLTTTAMTRDGWLSSRETMRFSDPTLYISGYPSSRWYRSLIQFDLSPVSIVSGNVASAKLRLYATLATNTNNVTMDVTQIVVPWGPIDDYAQIGFWGSDWPADGTGTNIDYAGGVGHRGGLGSMVITNTGWVEFDITDAAKYWLDRPAKNYGMLLAAGPTIWGVPGGSSWDIRFASSEAASNKPELVFELRPPPTLSIARSGDNLVVEWSDGWLETTTNLANPSWTTVLGGVSAVTVSWTEPARFFRAVRHAATEYVPVRKPYRMWYQPAFAESNPGYYRNANYVASGGGEDYARFWNSLGVAAGHWAFGPSNPWPTGDPNFYKQQANPNQGDWTSTGPGFDEWVGGYESEKQACAAGWRAARVEWPGVFMSCYFTGADDLFASLVADGTLDLAVIEGYFEISLEGALSRCAQMKSLGLIEKTITLFGHVFPAQTSKSKLNLWVSTVHDTYPEMPGIGMYGRADDSSAEARELIQYADWLTGYYYGDDVLFMDGFESGSFTNGQWTAGDSPVVREGFTWNLNDAGCPWTGGGFQFCGTGSTSSAVPTAPGLVEIDVTAVVNEWLYQGKLNNGFMIQLGGPHYGVPGGTAMSFAFDSAETSQASLAPKLMVKIAPDGQYQTVQGPASTVDGNLSMRSVYSRDFTGPSLSTFFSPWWDYGAVYLRFDLSGINKSGYSSVSNAKLVLNATSVSNPDSAALRVQRVSESNFNTEPEMTGADSRRCVQLGGAQSIQRAVSTAGRSGIRLEYMVRADGFTSGDHCYVEWYDGSAWNVADDISQASAFTARRIDLPGAAAYNPDFKIRFRAALSGGKALIDLVRLTGTKF